MRLSGREAWGAALLAGLVLVGCGDDAPAGAEKEMTIVLEGDTAKLKEKEDQLARQRAELTQERARLLDERQGLIERLKGGGGVDGLVELQRQLLEREKRLQAREDALAAQQRAVGQEKDRILEGVVGTPAPAAPAAAGAQGLAGREARLAAREADLARREKRVAEREARVGEREAALAAQVGAAVAAREPGRTVSRDEVESAHRKVRAAMLRRGILTSDLPADVAALERRIYRSSKRGRWLQAYDAVRDLGAAVDALKVDEAFVQAKMTRLATVRRRRKNLTADQSAQVESLLGEATAAFADGRYEAANVGLNRIFGVLTN